MTLTFTVRPPPSVQWQLPPLESLEQRRGEGEGGGSSRPKQPRHTGSTGCLCTPGCRQHIYKRLILSCRSRKSMIFVIIRKSKSTLYQVRCIESKLKHIAYFFHSTISTCSSLNLEYKILQKLWFEMHMWPQRQSVELLLESADIVLTYLNYFDLCL